ARTPTNLMKPSPSSTTPSVRTRPLSPCAAPQIDVPGRPRVERATDRLDEDRRSGRLHCRRPVASDEVLDGRDPVPTARLVERSDRYAAPEVAECSAAGRAHRRSGVLHKHAPHARHTCTVAHQHSLDARDLDVSAADSYGSPTPPDMRDDVAPTLCDDVHVVRRIAVWMVRIPFAVLREVFVVEETAQRFEVSVAQIAVRNRPDTHLAHFGSPAAPTWCWICRIVE